MINMQESIYMHRGTNIRVLITAKTGVNGNRRIYYRGVDNGPISHMGQSEFKRKYTHLKGPRL